jgi:glutathione S-transferase
MDDRVSQSPILWHLPVSHYSEKIRWALDYKRIDHERRAALPGAHMPLALWLTRGRRYTLPVMKIDGRAIGDSTAIIAALEERFPEPPLYPADPDERRRALELEDWFDEQLGPYIRRFGFYELRQDRELFDDVAARAAPPALARMRRAAGAYSRTFVGLRFGARNADAAERARDMVLAALDRLEDELGESDYLAGDRFTVADLTAASLFYPLVLPPEAYPTRLIDRMPERWRRFTESLAERRGYRWVKEMFRRHRRSGPAARRQEESLSGSR